MAIIAFDVDGTLLSLEPVTALLDDLLGEPVAGEWFAHLHHASLVVDHLDCHESLATVAGRVLHRLAATRGRELGPDATTRLAAALQTLPPHPDVGRGLAALDAAGHRLVAFSNGARTPLEAQLEHADITRWFDAVVSVDDPGGGRFRPDPRAYEHLCRTLDAFADEVTLVASHDWDVAGARTAGLGGVLLDRGAGWHLPVPPAPTVSTVGAVADVLS